MGNSNGLATKVEDLNLVDLQNLPRNGGIRIEVTKDLVTNQVTLEYHCQGKLQSGLLVYEGDASVIGGNNVEWVVDPATQITEIRIEPAISRSSNSIWAQHPEPDQNGPNWVGKVKKLPQGGPNFVEQSYLFHYWLNGSTKRRTIDPIIRVNK